MAFKLWKGFFIFVSLLLITSESHASSCGTRNAGALPNNGFYFCDGAKIPRYNHCGARVGTLTGLHDHWFYCTNESAWQPKAETVRVCENEVFTQCRAYGGNACFRGRQMYSRNKGWVWTPSPSQVCAGQRYQQTSNCGNKRNAVGTKYCPPPDDDADNVPNASDQCPGTPAGVTVNGNGCSQAQLDTDLDTVNNNLDQCPNTTAGNAVNDVGCALYQLDSDSDGISDELDQCANTDVGNTVSTVGCALYQLDTDSDGVNDELDQCPDTQTGSPINSEGCAFALDDFDGDGVLNDQDAYPFQDATQCLF